MLIKKGNSVIDLDKVRRFYLENYNNAYDISFEFNDGKQYVIALRINKKYAEEIFNEIIAYYNSGKKVYVIE